MGDAAASAPSEYVLEVCRDRSGMASDGCIEELAAQVGSLLVVQLLVQNAFEYGRLLLREQRTRLRAAVVASGYYDGAYDDDSW